MVLEFMLMHCHITKRTQVILCLRGRVLCVSYLCAVLGAEPWKSALALPENDWSSYGVTRGTSNTTG